ncbi:MAG: hypothetical protein WC175_05475, partial [Candidatus Dojkabacteria bacterium]
MKKFLLKNWGKILLLLILIVISVLSFKTGYSYLSNDNYSPDLNPILTIQRSIQSPAWRSYRVLGFASESEQADIFRSGFYYILDLFLPTWSLSQIFGLLCLVVGSWFTALISSNLVRDFSKKRYSELAFLLAGIFYISTLWTVWVYYQNMFPYITQFGFLPLVVWSLYRLVKVFNWKNALILFISTILFTSTFVIATLFVVDIIVISFLTLIFAIFQSKGLKEVLKKTFLTILLFVCTQLFWILPFIHYTTNVSGDVVDSHTNQTVTTSIIDLEKEAMTSLDSARMYTRILETTDDNSGKNYLFEDARDYLTYDFFKFVGLIPAIFSVIAIIFAVIKKRWIYVFIGLLAIGFWFIIKNLNPPLGSIYRFFQDNIPLFKQVFRWPSSKLGQSYIYMTSILGSVGLIYLLDFLTSFLKNRFLKIAIFVLSTSVIFLSLFFFSSYLFEGKLFVKRAIVSIPTDYYELGTYLEEKDPKGRILYLPTANNGYFREYNWGFVGSGFLHYILPNPLMDMSLSIGSEFGEDAMWEIRNLEIARDIEGIKNFIDKYEIKYILVDKNLIKGRYGYEVDWESSEKLANIFDKVWGDSDIVLYKTEFSRDTSLIETLTGELNTFQRKHNQNASIKPMKTEVKDWNIIENNLRGTFIYKGENGNSNLIYKNIDLEKLPSSIKIEDNKIIVSPAIPSISGITTELSKTFGGFEYDYYVIDNKVFTKTQLEEGVAVDLPYQNLNTVYGVSETNWEKQELTKYLLNNSRYGNCSGTEFEENLNVQPQGFASGFSISGDVELPCMYSNIELTGDGILRLLLNWEDVTEDTYIGYCLYSEHYEKCLNQERYILSKNGFGKKELLIPYHLDQNDNITLTLYTYSPTLEYVETVFREITLDSNSKLNRLISLEENKTNVNILELIDGMEYTVNIPLIWGDNSYIYQSSKKDGLIWQVNDSQTRDMFEISWNGGIKQTVQKQYINQYKTLFETNSLDKYLWYWSGRNISNIPATLCLTYDKDDKCWVDDVFADNRQSSSLNYFESKNGARLDLSYRSVSYSDITSNILNDFVVMKFPKEWEFIEYRRENEKMYDEYELASIDSNSQGTTYSLSDLLPENSIITIPQASESGWLAVSFK